MHCRERQRVLGNADSDDKTNKRSNTRTRQQSTPTSIKMNHNGRLLQQLFEKIWNVFSSNRLSDHSKRTINWLIYVPTQFLNCWSLGLLFKIIISDYQWWWISSLIVTDYLTVCAVYLSMVIDASNVHAMHKAVENYYFLFFSKTCFDIWVNLKKLYILLFWKKKCF